MNARHEAILEVAEQLLAQHGAIPTVEMVREALGGGSFSTISPVLREWRNQQRVTHVVAGDIPPKVREALERATAALWGAFREEIEDRVARAQEAAQKRSEEAEEEREEALQEIARLEAAFGDAEEKGQAQRETLRVERDESRQNLTIAREEVATLAERSRQLEKQVQALTTELAHAHAETAAMREQTKEQAERQERDRQAAREREEALSRQLEGERQSRQSEHDRAEALAVQLAHAQSAQAKAEQEAETLNAALTQADEKVATLKTEVARLQERAGYMDELKAQVKALQDRLAAPVNQNQPKAPAKARPRRKGGQGEEVNGNN
jgi:chromosome segregation ATPase